jgi:membrane-bound lytic murein transglycosylase D
MWKMISRFKHIFLKRKIFLYSLLLLLFAAGFIPLAHAEEILFPVPKQLEKNVDFWTKIYGVYPTSSVIIHDKEDLSVIYQVIDFDDYFSISTDWQSKWALVDEEKEKYRAALQKLAEMTKPIAWDSLDVVQRYVYIEWAHVSDDAKYSRALENIRAQLGLSDRFRESIQRSGYYWNHIEAIFKEYGLPLELCYLPHVESLFNYESYSKAGAAGIWQFIQHTGRLFLTIDEAVDERVDPVSATVAAAKLLKKNYNELGSWPLAMTAYNHGLNGMKAARDQFGNSDFGLVYDQFKSRSFGFASKNFYAEFLAAMHVAQNYETYFGAIDIAAPIRFQSVELLEPLYVKQVSEIFEVTVDTLIAYNRAFRPAALRNLVQLSKGYHLRLPYREGFDPREVLVQRTIPSSGRSSADVVNLPQSLVPKKAQADSLNQVNSPSNVGQSDDEAATFDDAGAASSLGASNEMLQDAGRTQ